MVLSSERLDIIQRKLEQSNEGIMHVLRESSSALDDTSSSSTTKKCHTLDDDDENTKKKSMDEKLSEGDSPSSLQNKSDTITSSSDTEATHNINTAESSSKVQRLLLPARRLRRNNSTKGGSFRGGSLKNVMEDAEETDDDYSQDVDDFTDNTILPTRGLSRSSSGRVIRKRNNGDKKNATNRLLPARRLSRSSSAKGGSFRGGSLKNVMEDKEADMNMDTSKEEQQRFEGDRVEGPAERRQSHPPGRSMLQSIAGSEASFRSSLVESIRLYNSNSSLSSASCSANNNNYNPRGSIDLSDASPNQSAQRNGSSINIMDFGVSVNRFSQSSMLSVESASQRSLSSTMSSSNKESLLDSDGFLGWGGNSSRNIRVELNPQIKGRKGNSVVPMKKINTANVHLVSGDKGLEEGLGSSNLSSLVDSQGFLNWEGKGSSHGDSPRALSARNDGGPTSSTADDQNEGNDANDDVVINLKQSTSSSRLSKQMRRISSSLTASIKRSSWNNDEPNNGPSVPLRSSTGNASLKGSIIKTIFDRRRSSETGSVSFDQDEQYFERSIINHRSEDNVDISELRRELCVAAEGGANNKKLLKNVIF